MYELSLFSGVGGGLLATKHLLGWRTIGYVEWDNYCQKVLAQRIRDGLLDEAPIFSDIRAFIGEGYAERYRGMVDVITAGFPCQPFSVAGKQKGADDNRNMWPSTADTIQIINPNYILLENVPGIRQYLPVIYRDLRRIGYKVFPPIILGADDCGANHRRKRLWILAYPRSIRPIQHNVISEGQQYSQGGETFSVTRSCGDDVADTMSKHSKKPISRNKLSETSRQISTRGESMGAGRWWATEPRLGRVAHGVAHRVDRLKAIGNGQVPAVVRAVWGIITGT